MYDWIWSYLLVGVGLVGFVLAGRKIWYAWYVNFFCQFLWFAYAIITQQWGFIVGALVYAVVFGTNAVKWTDEWYKARSSKKTLPNAADYPEGTILLEGQTYPPGSELPWGGTVPFPQPPVVEHSGLSPENAARLRRLNEARAQGLIQTPQDATKYLQ